MTKREYFDVGVIIPLREELEAFQDNFDLVKDYSTETSFRYTFNTGSRGITGIVIQQTEMGKSAAYQAAKDLADNHEIGLLVCLGIAGGISSDLKIGDISYSERIIDVLDNAKVSERGGKTIHEFSPSHYSTDARIVSALNFSQVHPDFKDKYRDWQSKRKEFAKKLFPGEYTGRQGKEKFDAPNSMAAKIACAAVSKSTSYNEELIKLERKISTIETESGGVFRAAGQRPALTIRGISDYADGDKALLETETGGKARKLAASNAASFFKLQLGNVFFKKCLDGIRAARELGVEWLEIPKPSLEGKIDDLLIAVRAKINDTLRELSPEFRLQKQGYVLPVPRVRLAESRNDTAKKSNVFLEDFRDISLNNERSIVSVRKNYPDKGLAWVLANDLLVATKDSKQVIPIVVDSAVLGPPDHGFEWFWKKNFSKFAACKDQIYPVYILSGSQSRSPTKCSFIFEELRKLSNSSCVLLLSDQNDKIDSESRANGLSVMHCELAEISFLETTNFLEKNFDMPVREAEVVAKRLRTIFEQFDLSAHPSYFAGIPLELLSSLLHANRRAELISLAVAGFLSYVVASDSAPTVLGRTTREQFLRRLAFEIKVEKRSFDETELVEFTRKISEKMDYGIVPLNFINSFVENGILNFQSGKVSFSLAFIESYLLAKELSFNDDAALKYFDLDGDNFDSDAFDLYVETAPSDAIVNKVITHLESCIEWMDTLKLNPRIIFDLDVRLDSVLKSNFLDRIRSRLSSIAERVKANGNEKEEKQRIIDLSEQINERAVEKRKAAAKNRSVDLDEDKQIGVAVTTFIVSVTLLGSGSERLDGEVKQKLATKIVELGTRIVCFFSEVVNAVDFSGIREEFTSQHFLESVLGKAPTESILNQQRAVLTDLVSIIEFHAVASPFKAILSFLAENARSPVLLTSIGKARFDEGLPALIAATWLVDIDSTSNKTNLIDQIKKLPSGVFVRVVLGIHLVYRAYWHKWRHEDRFALVEAAEAALKSAEVTFDRKAVEMKLELIEEESRRT
jgi:nucleoside phosphorylase